MVLTTDSSTNSFILSAFGDVDIDPVIKKFGGGAARFLTPNPYFATPINYIEGPDIDIPATDDFTIEFWYIENEATPGDYQPSIFEIRSSFLTNTNTDFSIYLHDNVRNIFIYGNNQHLTQGYFAPANANQKGVWRHLAVVRSDYTLRVFLDGILRETGYYSNSISGKIYLGLFQFIGHIDDLRITKKTARYISNFEVPTRQFPDPTDLYRNNVSLLLHMNGETGSQIFTDSSPNNYNIITRGNLTYSNTIKKFGSGSADFDGNVSNYLELNSTEKFAFENMFTIEGWFYFKQNNIGYQPLLAAHNNGDYTGWVIILETDNRLAFYGSSGNSWNTTLVTNFVPPVNQWIYIAFSRDSESNLLFVLNNSSGGIYGSNRTSPIVGGNKVTIGHYPYFPDYPRSFNGYIDEVRITKGHARYTFNNLFSGEFNRLLLPPLPFADL